MLKCDQITRLVSESKERALSVSERMALRMHVMMCSGCRNFERQMEVIRVAMRKFSDDDHASPTNSDDKPS